MSKTVKITENELVDLIDKIVNETVTEKKKQWIAEQKAKNTNLLESKIAKLEAKVKQIIKEEMVLKEGEQWVDGNWSSDNYKNLIQKVEEIISKGSNGASFSYNGKDFTIIKKGDRYNISSDDWGYGALNVDGAIVAAHKFSTGSVPKSGFQK